MFQSLWKACGIFEVFPHEAAQRPPGRLPMSGAYIVSCWKRAICRRTIASTLRSRLPRKSRQPLRFAQIAVNSCSARRPRRRDFRRSNQPFFRTQVAAAIADTELGELRDCGSPDPCQRMRFSRSKLDKVGEQTRGLRFTEASQDWVETAPRDETSITAPVQSESSYFCRELILAFAPTEATRPKRVEDPRPSRVRLSTSNLSQKMRNDKEHRCEIAQK